MTPLSGKALARIVESIGWSLQRISGSNHVYVKPGAVARLSIPIHGNQALKGGLQRHLMKLADLPTDR